MLSSRNHIVASSFLCLFLPIPFIQGLRDPTIPCLQGLCASATQSNGANPLSSVLLISGSPDDISDITPAAGWEMLDCMETEAGTSHILHLACGGPQELCLHLLKGGPMNKIVRLPENCGKSPFARIKAWDVVDSQNEYRYTKRKPDPFHGTIILTIDSDFSRLPQSTNSISFLLVASTVSSELIERILNSQQDGLALDSESYGDSQVSDILTAFSLGPFNDTISTTLPEINFQGTAVIFNQSFSEQNGQNVSAEASLSARIDTQIAFGVVAKGVLIPPSIYELGIFAAITGDFGGSLDFSAEAAGLFNDNIALFSDPLPGIDIHGVLSIEPIFAINANIEATSDTDIDLSMNVSYHAQNIGVAFPPSATPNSVSVYPSKSSLQFSSSQSTSSNATFSMHIVPSFSIGLTVPSFVSTTVSFVQDVYATLDLTFSAQSGTGTTANPPSRAELEGCAVLQGGFNVDVGADGSFFGIFNNTTVSVVKESALLLQRCFMEAIGQNEISE